MRFLLNFFFFGLLFYLIWMFFPDAFMTLVHWADQVVAFFRDLIMGISNRVQNHQAPTTPVPAPAHALLFLFPFLQRRG